MIRVADPPENDRFIRLGPGQNHVCGPEVADFRKKQRTRLQAIHASLIDVVDTVSGLGRKQATTSPQIPPSLRSGPMGRRAAGSVAAGDDIISSPPSHLVGVVAQSSMEDSAFPCSVGQTDRPVA